MVASSPGRVVSKINWRPLETTQPGEEPTFKDKSIVTISTLYACKLHSEISFLLWSPIHSSCKIHVHSYKVALGTKPCTVS